MATVRRSYRFHHERVVGLARATHGDWVLALDLGDIWQHSPASPHDPTRALVQALPGGVCMVSVSCAGKGLEVTLVSKAQPPLDEALRASSGLSAYEEVRVKSSIRSSYDQAIVTIVYVRKRSAR
jgi:hypothetical protein